MLLQVFNRAASDSSQRSTENIALGTNFTLVKLQPYTSYNVTVQAFTAVGGGEKTDVQVMTDEAGESREVGGGGEDFQANCVGMV